MNELDLVAALKSQAIPGFARDIIGDDCAPIHGRNSILTTTDMLMDLVHFNTATMPIDLIGHKAVNVNLSDLAASGALPHSLLVSLALPDSWSTEQALTLLHSMSESAKAFGASIIGGDTNVWRGPLVINVVAHGIAHWRGQITRSTAKPGDLLFVTGPLGGSFLSGRHLIFSPRVRESQWLLDHFDIHAMLDISDGLATDAKRLAEASKVDIVLHTDDIPIHSDCRGTPNEQLDQALCDGEDFELLFCVGPDEAISLCKTWPWQSALTQIGEVTSGEGKLWTLAKNQTEKKILTKSGFVHGQNLR